MNKWVRLISELLSKTQTVTPPSGESPLLLRRRMVDTVRFARIGDCLQQAR